MTATYFRADFEHGSEYRSSLNRKYAVAAAREVAYETGGGRVLTQIEVSFHASRNNAPRDAFEVVFCQEVDAKKGRIAMERKHLAAAGSDRRLAMLESELSRYEARIASNPDDRQALGNAEWTRDLIAACKADAVKLTKHIAKHGEV